MLIEVCREVIRDQLPPDLHVPSPTRFQRPHPLCSGNLELGIPKLSVAHLLAIPIPYPLSWASVYPTPTAAPSIAHRAPGAAPPGPTREHGAPGQGQAGQGQADGILTGRQATARPAWELCSVYLTPAWEERAKHRPPRACTHSPAKAPPA